MRFASDEHCEYYGNRVFFYHEVSSNTVIFVFCYLVQVRSYLILKEGVLHLTISKRIFKLVACVIIHIS